MVRWVVLLTLWAALFEAANLTGWVSLVLTVDTTYITWVVGAVTVIGFVSLLRTTSLVDWLCAHGVPLMFGLLGTLVGFMSALSGAVDGNLVEKLSGVNTALVTTIAGLVSHMVLLASERVMRRKGQGQGQAGGHE